MHSTWSDCLLQVAIMSASFFRVFFLLIGISMNLSSGTFRFLGQVL